MDGGPDRWQAWAGADLVGTLRAWVRPDQRCVLLLRDCHDEAYRPLLARATAELDRDLYLSVDEADAAALRTLAESGFTSWRREHRYRIPADPDPFPAVPPPPGIELVSAADADLDRLRELDDALRNEIPGADGWRWGAEDFREETFSTGFDPATYLVAVQRTTGRHVGLIRVWLRADNPRLGCLGVLPEVRRTRVTACLVWAAVTALYERGIRDVTTEVDVTNRAANAVAARAGATRTGGLHHLLRPAPVPAA